MKSRILDISNKSIEPIACDSSADGERLSDGGTNPPLGVTPPSALGTLALTLRKVSYEIYTKYLQAKNVSVGRNPER